MADQLDWGSEAKEQPKPKRRVPVWAWFCGGGCVLALITVIVAALAIGSCAKEMKDPETQWKELERFVVVQSRPEGEILGFKVPLTGFQTFSIQQGMTKVDFMIASGQAGEQLRNDILDPDAKGGISFMGNIGRHGTEELTLNVQGRELRGVRFTSKPRDENAPEPAATTDEESEPGDMSVGEAMRMATTTSTTALDITPEGSGTTVVMMYQRVGSLEPIPDSEVIEFLSHFDLTKQP